MAQAFRSETTIAAPVDRVWATLTDWSVAPEWMAGIDGVEAGGPLAPGTRIVVAARGRRRSSTIVASETARRLVVRSEQGAVRVVYHYELEPVDESRCRVALTADCVVSGPLVIAAPLVRRSLRRTDGGQPEALRALVERGA